MSLRFLEGRMAGLTETSHPGRKPTVIAPKLQARVLEATPRKPTTRILKPKRPTSLLYTGTRRNSPPYSAWMKNQPCKLSTAWTPYFPDHPSERRGMASSTIVTARYLCRLRLMSKNGKVHGQTAARHTSEEFVGFLEEVLGLCRPGQELHIIVDNLSAHRTKSVAAFLEEHTR